MAQEVIRAEQVRFEYAAGDTQVTVALDGVDLRVTRGSFTAVLGHNGCGKSTLAKHCNALLIPTQGAVYINDIPSSDESRTLDIRRTVGMVLQNPDNQLVSTIVEEDVAFGPENLGVKPETIRRRVDEALKAVGMYEYREHAAHKLSGGQKQRVAIAGVLAMQPEVLVLDEPTAMLDPMGRAEVMETVHRLCRERGMTVLLITHYMEEAATADRVVVMESGRIMLDGTPREVFSHVTALREAALDVPQPTELCYELRTRGFPVSDQILSVDECVDALATLLEERHAHS